MKRFAILPIFFLLLGVFHSRGAQADDVLKLTASRVASAPSLTFKFTATTGDGATTSGTLVLSRDKFKMVTDIQSVWYDGSTLWSYSPSAAETTVSNPLPEELMEINPFDILSHYSSLYTVKKLTPLGKDQRIELNARKASTAVKKAVLVIDHATMLPKAIDVTFANSARMNVIVTSATTGKPLPASTFTYPKEKYPKVHVEDLR